MDRSSSEFSGFKSQTNTFSGTLANASLFGAKAVQDPSLSRVSAKFAAFTAVTSVDKELVAVAAAAIVGRRETGRLQLKNRIFVLDFFYLYCIF